MRADVQMMALNTTLKCSRIGETGKPLGVIAVELRAHAGHLETSAARTLTSLEGLSASADAQGRIARRMTPNEGKAAAPPRCCAKPSPHRQDRRRRRKRPGRRGAPGRRRRRHAARAAAASTSSARSATVLDQAASDLMDMSGEDDDRARHRAALRPLLAKLAKQSTPWPRNARSTRPDRGTGPEDARPEDPTGLF
jgi:hypothetical protein